jgi:hypothetical protein
MTNIVTTHGNSKIPADEGDKGDRVSTSQVVVYPYPNNGGVFHPNSSGAFHPNGSAKTSIIAAF